jgi:hypothetical protein
MGISEGSEVRFRLMPIQPDFSLMKDVQLSPTLPDSTPRIARGEGSSIESKLAYARSRAGNGNIFGRDVDRRSSWARRMRDLLNDQIADLGGFDEVSAAEHNIVRRVATITTELELLERKFVDANGAKPQDLQLYLTASNTVRRLLEAVGLQRRSKDVSPPTLDEIAQEIDDAKAAAATDINEDVAS